MLLLVVWSQLPSDEPIHNGLPFKIMLVYGLSFRTVSVALNVNQVNAKC